MNVGDPLDVKVTGIDSLGRIILSHRAVLDPDSEVSTASGENGPPRRSGSEGSGSGGERRGGGGYGGQRRPGSSGDRGGRWSGGITRIGPGRIARMSRRRLG